MSWLTLFLCLAVVSNAENILRNNTQNGQLEIFYEKRWRVMVAFLLGTPVEDHKVFCRTLGMPADDAWLDISIHPTKPLNPVSVNLTCFGNETSITECPVFDVQEKTYSYMQPFFMHCDDLKLRLAFGGQNYGTVQQAFGHNYLDVCPGKYVDDRRFAQVVCRTMGLKSDHAVNRYPHGPADVDRTFAVNVVLNCSDDDPASDCVIHTDDFQTLCPRPTLERLGAVICIDQSPEYQLTHVDNSTGIGRLEVKMGVSGAVCATNGDDAFATVACRSLGAPSTNAQSFPYMYMGNARTAIYEANCTGKETVLEECRSRWGKRCDNYAFIGISCSNASEGDLRLNTLKLGRLQIYNKAKWLGISIKDSSSNGFEEAKVICRSLNMSTIAVNGTISNTTDYCWLSVEWCSGNETTLMDCINTSIENSPFQCQPFTVTCGDGGDDYRIADDGQFEVRRFGVWGSVSVKLKMDFTGFAASIVCKTLNQTSTLASVSKRGEKPTRAGPIWYHGLECGPDANSLDDCSFQNYGFYYHEADVYIKCRELNVSSVRYGLSKMEVPEVGIPKISLNEKWGSICLTQATNYESLKPVAQVLCRSMGLRTDGARFVGMYSGFEPDSDIDNIWFDASAINCTGKEDTILNCTHGYPGDVRCYIHNLIPIYCGPPQDTPDYTIRLVDGPNTRSGRLEMMMYNQWGTICDDGFTFKDASTVCYNFDNMSRMDSSVAKRGTFQKGIGLIWPLDLQCSYRKETVSNCLIKRQTKKNCTHLQDVGVVCKVISSNDLDLENGLFIGISVGGAVLIVSAVSWAYKRKNKRMDAYISVKDVSIP